MSQRLSQQLKRIDGKSYGFYKDLRGSYEFDTHTLHLDHIQGDPFAAPSRVRMTVNQDRARLPQELLTTRTRRVALEDFVTRRFGEAIQRFARGKRGSGKSGQIVVDRPGQEVLESTSVSISEKEVEVRFFVGLPAAGRRVLAREAEEIFCGELPQIVEHGLFAEHLDTEEMRRHVETVEWQTLAREELSKKELIAFAADGAVLPRRSGVDDRPMPSDTAVPFRSPESLSVTLEFEGYPVVRGMGVPVGVTLIVGGGYHGKSTLLRAIERGVYDHIPGDGRERVVTDPCAVKIRAEDGRSVAGVDLSPFIGALPGGMDTRCFTTANASGSTSQAANIIEALEVGASTLLFDEDTSATNFLIRDARMQALIAKEHEPITPLIDRIQALHRDHGVSSMLVMGGSGDYLDVANTVIAMTAFRASDVSDQSRAVCSEMPSTRKEEHTGSLQLPASRVPLPDSLDTRRGRKDVAVRSRGLDEVQFGTEEIDLSLAEQLVDQSQTRAIAEILVKLLHKRLLDGRRTLCELMDAVDQEIGTGGLEAMVGSHWGNRALPRRFEIAAAINRLRALKVAPGK